jgi:hypothetical protein
MFNETLFQIAFVHFQSAKKIDKSVVLASLTCQKLVKSAHKVCEMLSKDDKM